jgi:hypothetical protein
MNPLAHPADPWVAECAAGVLERVAWGEAEMTLFGRDVRPITVITEVLAAAQGLHLLIDSTEPPVTSAFSVEAAVELLASYHVRYSLDPYRVLDSLDHAYTQARRVAQGQRELDRIDIAHALLKRHLRRAEHTEASQSTTVST